MTTDPTEAVAHNIADNIILYLDRTISAGDDTLKAIAAMNVAAVLARRAGLKEKQILELLRRCNHDHER